MRNLVELGKDDLFKNISPVDYSFRLEKWGTICGIEFELSKELQANLGVDSKASLTAWVNVTGNCALINSPIFSIPTPLLTTSSNPLSKLLE